MSLRKRLADYGFESNDDYDHALRCLFEAPLDHLRTLRPAQAKGDFIKKVVVSASMGPGVALAVQ